MRKIFLDLETTGLRPDTGNGDRIVEIGAIAYDNGRLCGIYHVYLDPQRASDPGAEAIHCLTRNQLDGWPTFAGIAKDFIAFLDGAVVYIHNAQFDVEFLDCEFERAGLSVTLPELCTIIDTLAAARSRWPRKRCGLDAICERLGIDRGARDIKHGALTDALLLARAWEQMTGPLTGPPGLRAQSGQ